MLTRDTTPFRSSDGCMFTIRIYICIYIYTFYMHVCACVCSLCALQRVRGGCRRSARSVGVAVLDTPPPAPPLPPPSYLSHWRALCLARARELSRVLSHSPTLERDFPPLIIETISHHVRLCLHAGSHIISHIIETINHHVRLCLHAGSDIIRM